jgi:hypothetical protein
LQQQHSVKMASGYKTALSPQALFTAWFPLPASYLKRLKPSSMPSCLVLVPAAAAASQGQYCLTAAAAVPAEGLSIK